MYLMLRGGSRGIRTPSGPLDVTPWTPGTLPQPNVLNRQGYFPADSVSSGPFKPPSVICHFP